MLLGGGHLFVNIQLSTSQSINRQCVCYVKAKLLTSTLIGGLNLSSRLNCQNLCHQDSQCSNYWESSNATKDQSPRINRQRSIVNAQSAISILIQPTSNKMAKGNNVVFLLLLFLIVTFPYRCCGNCAIEPDGDGHVTIPNNWTIIEKNAFDACSSLSAITIPDSVTSIGDFAFYSCYLSNIIIPNSVASIGTHTFNSCYSLSTITIPNSVTSIGAHAFSFCSSLSTITIPDSVTTLGLYALPSCLGFGLSLLEGSDPRGLIQCHTCTDETTITIPNNVTSVGSFAFRSCTSLSSITIPNSVRSIKHDAFAYCFSLSTILIPDR